MHGITHAASAAIISTMALFAQTAVAQAPQGDPKATEQWQPVPPLVTPGAHPGAAPSDAIVLFDGHNLDQWVLTKDHSPATWKVAKGIMTVEKSAGNIETKKEFGNYQLHLEWRIPKDITGEGQARGNSGVFVASTGNGDSGYEIQILDSWKNTTYVNGQAASIYKQSPPLVNAMTRPGEWQSYDVVWTAPTFAADGSVKTPAYLTLFPQRHSGAKPLSAHRRNALYRKACVSAVSARGHQAAGAWRSVGADQFPQYLDSRTQWT